MNRVVITGIGILSPLGVGIEETAAALREGEPALFPASRCQPPPNVSPLCGEVPAFKVDEFIPTSKAYLDRNSELLLAACGLALTHAGLDPSRLAPERSGIMVGTAWGGQDTMSTFFADYVRKGPRLVKPFLFPHTYFNTAISLAAIEWSLRGVHQSFASGRNASAQALVEAFDRLTDDEADVVLAGGCEALGHALFTILAAQGLLAPAGSPDHAGFIVPAEAGAVLVLERAEHAAKRGARVLARIAGSGIGGDCAMVASQALTAAGVRAMDLALIVSSANGAANVDAAERAVLGSIDRQRTPVFAPAQICGDTQGACSALHTALGVLLQTALIPPATRRGPALILSSDGAGNAGALLVEASAE